MSFGWLHDHFRHGVPRTVRQPVHVQAGRTSHAYAIYRFLSVLHMFPCCPADSIMQPHLYWRPGTECHGIPMWALMFCDSRHRRFIDVVAVRTSKGAYVMSFGYCPGSPCIVWMGGVSHHLIVPELPQIAKQEEGARSLAGGAVGQRYPHLDGRQGWVLSTPVCAGFRVVRLGEYG